jgi:hypothetical protein
VRAQPLNVYTELERDMHDPPDASGERKGFHTTPPPSKLPLKVRHIDLAEMLKSSNKRRGERI